MTSLMCTRSQSLAEEFEADNDLEAARKYWKLAADYFALDEYGK